MRRSGMLGAVLAGAWLGIATLTLADDYEGGIDGKAIYPVESNAIRMVRERVEVFVLEWGGPHDHAKVHVSAEFVLANESNEPRSILVAFPNSAPLDGFRRFVDGQEVEVEMRPDANGVPQWPFVSQVAFEPRQTRRVRVQYGAHAGGSNGYPETWSYILTTGALWKGRIAEAVVTVHFPMSMPLGGAGPFRAEAISMKPKGYKVNGQTVTWRFKDFEPRKNIELEWSRGSAEQASNPLKYASPEEAPGLQLELALSSWGLGVVRALEALRKAYPDSQEATKVDYHIARQHWRHWLVTGWSDVPDRVYGGTTVRNYLPGIAYGPEPLKRPGRDQLRAIGHYEAALKQPLPDALRRDTLKELFLLYTLDAPDPAKAQKALESLKAERLDPWEERTGELVRMVAAASPKAGLALLETMTFTDRDGLRSSLELLRQSLREGPRPVAQR